jgi:phosphoribosylaminoimidazole-succinocarboxamide synthase
VGKLDKSVFNNLIETTSLERLGLRYQGKVRDNYSQDKRRIIIATDRLSCFDRVVTSIPYKGRSLSQLALWWFKQTEEIIPNHLIASPHPNVVVVKNCEILPIEVVVRSYLAGSAWRDYVAGNTISGVSLPAGMKESQKLPEVIVTPSTKAELGTHDMPISEQQILDQKIISPETWETVKSAALKLFALGQKVCEQRGLIFVDTKYEFGIYEGQILLADEIHTMDSSRFWVAQTYQQRFESGQPQQMLDKEPVRQWLLAQGFKGDGEIPTFSEDYRLELAQHYLDSFKMIAGQDLDLSQSESIEESLRDFRI